MSIVYLTAGAAGMFCGSCMHDNSVAKELIAQGHECLLVPVYTPIRTDEADQSIDKVFFGGINVFLQQKAPWLAYLPHWVDDLLNRPRLIQRLTKGAMKTDPKFLGALTVSMLRGAEGNQKKEVRRLQSWLQREIRPRTLLLTNMLIAGAVPELKATTGASVFATLQGDDIFLDSLPEPYRSQAIQSIAKIVPFIDGFIVHSRDYGDRMASWFSIPSSKIHVIPLGIDTRDFQSLPPRPPGPYRIGYLARLAPEKGLHQLVEAFIAMAKTHPEIDATLEVAGWKGPQHETYWSGLQDQLTKANLRHRCTYHGSVDRMGKIDFLSRIDLLCVPTVYQEPKGLFVLEAAAAGIPYLLPAHGAFPEMHARLQFGSLVPPGEPQALANALSRAVQEGPLVDRKIKAQQMLEKVGVPQHVHQLLQVVGR